MRLQILESKREFVIPFKTLKDILRLERQPWVRGPEQVNPSQSLVPGRFLGY